MLFCPALRFRKSSATSAEQFAFTMYEWCRLSGDRLRTSSTAPVTITSIWMAETWAERKHHHVPIKARFDWVAANRGIPFYIWEYHFVYQTLFWCSIHSWNWNVWWGIADGRMLLNAAEFMFYLSCLLHFSIWDRLLGMDGCCMHSSNSTELRLININIIFTAASELSSQRTNEVIKIAYEKKSISAFEFATLVVMHACSYGGMALWLLCACIVMVLWLRARVNCLDSLRVVHCPSAWRGFALITPTFHECVWKISAFRTDEKLQYVEFTKKVYTNKCRDTVVKSTFCKIWRARMRSVETC